MKSWAAVILGMGILQACIPAGPAPLGDGGINDGGADSGTPDSGRSDGGAKPAGTLALEDEVGCDRVASGAASVGSPAAALSSAYAHIRYFSPIANRATVDKAFVQSVDHDGAVGEASALALGKALDGVCALRSQPVTLPAVALRQQGEVAVVSPGVGPVTLPLGTQAVAIDLRGLPDSEEAYQAVARVLQAALKGEVVRSRAMVRRHHGYANDFAETMDGVYFEEVVDAMPLPALTGTAETDRPLALLTGRQLSPAIAALVGDLRLGQRAWIVGDDVSAATAEARWYPVGEVGLSVRVMDLKRSAASRWPDTLAADFPADQWTQVVENLATLGVPAEVPAGEAKRRRMQLPESGPLDRVLSLGTARASLLIVHGTLRHFFPYFTVVGDHIDERLDEVLHATDHAPVLDRRGHLRHLQRLGEAISDGHNFTGDYSGEIRSAGHLLLQIDEVAGTPVVSASQVPGISPGDTLLSVAGTAMADWYAAELPRTSAATPGYKFDLATRRYMELEGPTQFAVRGIDNQVRQVMAAPGTGDQVEALYRQAQRHSGPLADLGAPDFYYLNLDGYSLEPAGKSCAQAMTEAAGASGLVIDMRGYPGEEGFACLGRVARQRMYSGHWHVPMVTVSARTTDDDQWWLDPVSPAFTGDAVLIVGPRTVSAAETISMLLVDAKRVKAVVGRRSAGTNGNITYIALPGATYFSFTGMDTRHADGSVFHGQGIVPTIEVLPQAADYALGVDRAIAKAVELLRQP